MARRVPRPRLSTVVFLIVVVVPVVVVAAAIDRRGSTWGDDFALYLRQAHSLMEGNVGQVIADNRANVQLAAKPGFSPYVYPWVMPALFAPFTRLWGLDTDKLRYVEIACWCGFLGFWFALLRRRMAPWLALLGVAASGYSIAYLQHTTKILSELPYLCLVAATFWYLDRLDLGPSGRGWQGIERRSLVTLGVLGAAVFNTRREGLAIVAAVAALQSVDTWRRRRTPIDWRTLAVPHATFIGVVVAFQLALPSALAPEYEGAGLGQTWLKMRDTFQATIVQQLGFTTWSSAARLCFGVVVLAGVVIGVRRRVAQDLGFVVFVVGSLTIVGMIPANSDRYTLAVTPFLAYFAIQALAAVPRSRSVLGGLAAATLLAANLVDVPDALRATRAADRDGAIQTGPDQPTSVEMLDAVKRYTHRDDLVAFFKGRALTLYTERRAVQSKDLDIILERADFFVMGRLEPVGIPVLTDEQAATAGLVEVWSNAEWVLWRVPDVTAGT